MQDVVTLPFEVPELHGMLYHQAKLAAVCHYHQWLSQTAYVLDFVLEKHWARQGGWDL